MANTEHGRPHQAAGRDDKAAKDAVVTPYTGDVVSTPPASLPHLGGKQVEVIMGPYRGAHLIMPESEADQAINDHWARDLVATLDPAAEVHPPLTDAELEAAIEAANTWAAKANLPPEGSTDPQARTRHATDPEPKRR